MADGASGPRGGAWTRGLGLALVLVLGCAPSPPSSTQPAPTAAPATADGPPRAAPAPSAGLTADELLALPEGAEVHAWDQDPNQGQSREPRPAQPKRAPTWDLALPVDEHGAEWWPVVAASQGLDGAAFAAEHHVVVRFADRSFAVPLHGNGWTGERPEPEELSRWLPPVQAAFSQYPSRFLAAARIEHFVLARDLRHRRAHRNGSSIGGAGVIIMNSATFEAASQREIARAVHHEVFHALDYADDGDTWTDPAWESLNSKGARYGSGGASMQQTPGAGDWDDDRPGFLTQYATSAVPEDKAETFSWMMSDLPRVEARAARDPVLARKVARMKQLCAAFSPDLDEGFWSIRRLQARSTRD